MCIRDSLYIARTGGQEIVNSKRGKVEKNIGARMLQYISQYAADSYVVTATSPQGEATYQRDAQGKAVCKESDCSVQDAKIRGFSANLDVVRELGRHLGYVNPR